MLNIGGQDISIRRQEKNSTFALNIRGQNALVIYCRRVNSAPITECGGGDSEQVVPAVEGLDDEDGATEEHSVITIDTHIIITL